MQLDDEVTAWIKGLRQDDAAATEQLWQRYYRRLVVLAAQHLPANVRREFDEEDVALSAIDSLFRGVRKGRFPQLTDRDSLWALLIVITLRKCRGELRRRSAEKRGGGRVLGESAVGQPAGRRISDQITGDPSPEVAASLREQVHQLLTVLPDPATRQLAVLKMEGHTNQEAAELLDCSLTTVERRLRLIRKSWSRTLETS